jgi:transcriptional regulator with XRE-family HTH domain
MNYFAENIKALRKEKGLKQAEIHEILGFPRTTWSSYENGASQPDIDGILRIADFFGVAVTDMLSRDLTNAHLILEKTEGKKQKNAHLNAHLSAHLNTVQDPIAEFVPQVRTLLHTVDKAGKDNIILVPVKAQAGYLLGSQNAEFIEKLTAFWFPGLNNGVFRAFEVAGYSMFIEKGAGFNPGDIVIAEYVENPQQIRDNQVYVLVNDAGEVDNIVLKRCLNRLDTPDGKIWCKSDNKDPQYATFPLAVEQIKEVWRFKRKITAQAPDPSGIFERLNELEGRLNDLDYRYRKLLDK